VKTRSLAAACILLGLSLAACAGEPPPALSEPAVMQASLGAPAAPGAKPRKVCKPSGVTGSRVGGEMVCKTQAEWEAIAARHRRDTDTMRDRAMQGQTSKGM